MRNSQSFDSSASANISDPTLQGLAAFIALIRPFERAIYLVAMAIVNEPEEALLIVRQCVLLAFRSTAKMLPVPQFKTWLVALAIEHARAFLRQKKRISIDEIFADDEAGECDFGRDPRGDMRGLSADVLAEAVSALPRKDRLVLFLRDVLQLTTGEAANLLGISEHTIRLRLARARFG